MRLSNKGWNNVLIFGVLTIVFIFNFSHKLTLSPQVNSRTIIPKQETIVEIKTPDSLLTRHGREWQLTPPSALTQPQLNQLVAQWQQLALKTQENVAPNNHYPIFVYVANKQQPYVVNLIEQDDHYLLQVNGEITLRLETRDLPSLLGR